jgi:hypothetical protein
MTNEPKYVVYVACDPDTLEVRYVGYTSLSLKKRIRDHLYVVRKGSTYHSHNWMRQVLGAGLIPKFEVVHRTDIQEDAEEAEIFLIALLRSVGCRLTNTASGGKISDGWKGKHRSLEEKLKISASTIGIPKTIEHAANISIGKMGHLVSEETKLKISKANIGRYQTPDEITKRAAKAWKKVVDQHGTVYSSIKVAAEVIGLFPSNVGLALKRGTLVRGFHFKYLEKEE